MLGLPGLKRGLLAQGDRLHRGRWAAESPLEVRGQHASAGLDGTRPRRPTVSEFRVDAHQLTDLPLAVLSGAGREPHAQPSLQLGLEEGVVGLRQGDRSLVQRAAVDREPVAGQRLRLVADRDVGVKVRVAGAGVAVGELRGHQATRPHLLDALPAAAGEQHLPLQVRQGRGNGGVMRSLHLPRDRRRRHRPQRRDRLHRRERQVVAGDRGRPLPARSSEKPGPFPVVQRRPAVLVAEHLVGHLGADPRPDLGRDRRIPWPAVPAVVLHQPPRHLRLQRVAGTGVHGELPPQASRPGNGPRVPASGACLRLEPLGLRVAARPEQVPHVRLGDLRAGLQAEPGQPGAPPPPGRLTMLGVVVPEAPMPLLGRILHRNLPREVCVPVAGSQLVQPHHTGTSTPPRTKSDSHTPLALSVRRVSAPTQRQQLADSARGLSCGEAR